MPLRVPSGEFVRDVGYWLNEALREPVEITHHGKVKLRLAVPDAAPDLENDPVDPDRTTS